MLATELGGCKVEPIWMADHIDLTNSHWKNKCVMVSSCWQKTHFLLPCQLRLARLSLVRITPRRKYHANTLVFSGIFIFQSLLLLELSTGISGRMSVLYIESTENLSFFVRFHWNLSGPSDKWIESNRMSKSFQDVCRVPSKLFLNETFGGKVSNTFAIVSLLFRTIEYRARYCSLRVDWPSQISS